MGTGVGGGLLDWQQEVTGSPVMGHDLGVVAEKDGRPGTEMWSAGRVENKAVAQVTGEERAGARDLWSVLEKRGRRLQVDTCGVTVGDPSGGEAEV